MFANYVKVAFRNLLRNKVYSLINIGGLAHGLACCLLIVAFIGYEYSFDQFHKNADRIYRVLLDDRETRGVVQSETPAGMAPALKEDMPEVESVIRMATDFAPILRFDDKKIVAQGLIFADSEFFDVFSFPLVKGDPATCLREPNSLVVTQQAAQNLFGNEDPMGKVIASDGGKNFVITGIAADVPGNSHFSFKMVAPFRGMVGPYLSEDGLRDFVNWNYQTYVLLARGADISALTAHFPTWIETYIGKNESKNHKLLFQPLKDIHLSGLLRDDTAVTTDRRYLTLLGTIALVILFIACANFMNLSTARSLRRAREVGLRKVLGSVRSRLMMQFLGESLFLSLLALPLAVAFAELVLPVFDQYVNRHLDLLRPLPLGIAFGLSVMAGLIGGLYPAIYLSWFKPIDVLKGRFQAGRQGTVARRALIVAQFGITTVLMVSTLVVLSQFRYMKTADPGFRRDQIVYTTMGPGISESYDAFRQRLLANPNIQNVARAAALPGYVFTSQTYIAGDGTSKPDTTTLNAFIVDEDVIPTLEIKLIAGRNFSRDHPADETESYIINESAARALGMKDPVGMALHVWSRPPTGRIIGVVKDFNFRSLHQPIGPLVLRIERGWCWAAIVRLGPNDVSGSLNHIQRVAEEMSPDYPFSYRFLNETLAKLYSREERLSRILTYLTGAAVFIAALGLFGLASFTAEQRIKEFGVRKVLGAGVGQLVSLLIRQFTVWVLLAIAIALPVAYYVAGKWLQNFAYRVGIGWQAFTLAVGAVVAIAVLTVIVQAIRAARMNPADSLRYE